MNLKKFIRDVPDFPKPGIVFKDITPLLGHGPAFAHTVQLLAEVGSLHKVDKVVAIESRGFLFGAAVAQRLGIGVVPVRKKGKLPFKTFSATYQLEYGHDTLEVHVDGLCPGERVLLVDDVLATGGTVEAVSKLVVQSGAHPIAAAFAIELEFLKGRRRLAPLEVVTLVSF